MKVSVLMLAYNHAQYIAQAVDSVLMQQVDFDYEIVIGEDCSTDNTRDILIRYQQEYPDKIRLLLPEKNLGMHDNFVQTFKACRGDYIALLEGDDYWTSPDKLQKQVDLLDAHTDYTICFHSALVLNQDGSKTGWWNFPADIQQKKVKRIFRLEDVLSSCNIMPTASIMFRQGFIHEFPDWFYNLDFGDWVLQILLAQHGNIGYIDEDMCMYRVHSQGNWSQKSILERSLEVASMFQYISKHLKLKSKEQKQIKVTLSIYCRNIAIDYKENGDIKNAKKYLDIWFFQYFLTGNILMQVDHLITAASYALQIHVPTLYKSIKKFNWFGEKIILP